MKNIKLYIALSIDGYIARPNGSVDWLTDFSNPSETDYEYLGFLDSIDTIIMGGETYREILNLSEEWPYKEKESYVISHHTQETEEPVRFITDNVIETITRLQEKEGTNIWLVGGGKLTSMLLNHDMIDEMQLFYIPVILGEGIPLFPVKNKESKWNLLQSKASENGILEVTYQRT